MSGANKPVIEPPAGVKSNFENPTDVLRTVNLTTQYLSIAVVSVFVAFRLLIKVQRYSRFDIEDYATIISWVLFLAFCACMIMLSHYGGGYHAWDVTKEQFLPFQKITYAITIIYVPMAFAVKVALLYIVIRIFSPDRKKVMVVYVILGTLLVYYIPCLIMKIFACRPISAYWEGTENGGWCLNQQKVIMADSVISMVSDLCILVLPLPLMWNLHIQRGKKLRVVGLLGAGGVATAFSVWRLVIMIQDGASPDYTVLFIESVLTGNAEAGLGLICACLPVISSYWTFKKKALSEPTGSNSYEISSWREISASTKHPARDRDFPNLSPDQTELICTIEGGAANDDLGYGGSITTLPSQETK